MDTHDVSNTDHFVQFLVKQKETLNAAIARQGEQPNDRRSRRELVNKFMLQSIIQHMQKPMLKVDIHSSFVPPPYPPSTARLEELKQIFIKDLKLGTHHRGSYILVRSITPPNRITAIMAIVEDEREDATMLQLYQQEDKDDRPATSVIKPNDVFLVKEPYFKIMSDGEYGLRVDHVSDLVYIEVRNEMLPKQWSARIFDLGKTTNDWKLEGNDAMKRQQYWIAIQR
jgi:hypothetical protein